MTASTERDEQDETSSLTAMNVCDEQGATAPLAGLKDWDKQGGTLLHVVAKGQKNLYPNDEQGGEKVNCFIG